MLPWEPTEAHEDATSMFKETIAGECIGCLLTVL